jgi:hypothetical protein
MKNVTFSADDDLIEQARSVARAQRKTLNDAFREWLHEFVRQSGNTREYRSLMKQLRHINSGGRFSREQMNER